MYKDKMTADSTENETTPAIKMANQKHKSAIELLNSAELKIMSRSVNEGFARYSAAAFISQLDPTLEELSDIKTAVSEAVTNSIVHGYKNSAGTIYISLKYYSDRTLKIRVRDNGIGIPDVKKAMEPLFTTDPGGERGGMGFTVMECFTDRLTVSSTPGKGTVVTMTKKLSATKKD